MRGLRLFDEGHPPNVVLERASTSGMLKNCCLSGAIANARMYKFCQVFLDENIIMGVVSFAHQDSNAVIDDTRFFKATLPFPIVQ
jgi:hypothetical protein